ncbi:hypothetical protein PGB90_010659 [Kerria lacca]
MPPSWAMNKKPLAGCSYVPTAAEHVASIFTHVIMIPIAIVASVILVLKASTFVSFFVALIYGTCGISLFIVSSAFHISFYLNDNKKLTDNLRKSDRAVIYLFMAACYSPWLFLIQMPQNVLFLNLRWLIWLLAFLGVLFEMTCSRRYPALGIIFYLLYGIVPGILLDLDMQFPAISELKFSGAFYLIGVMFFRSEGIIPFAHAIWHILVIFGVSMHYLTIYKYFYAAEYNNLLILTGKI